MKKSAVILALALFTQALPDVARAEISSRDARQLRLAARHSPRMAKAPKAVNLEEVCTDIDPLAGNLLHKSEGSGHLRNDPRGTSCALIWGSGNYNFPRGSSFKLYDSLGNQLSAYRVYERNGCPFPLRAYSNWSKGQPTCKQIAARALANTGNRQGYIHIGGGSCMKINSILGRQGGNRAGLITSNKKDCRR